MDSFGIILRPIVSEKATQLSQEGTYAFYVHPEATKIDVKRAIKIFYGVEVSKVNMLYRQEKKRTVGKGKFALKRPGLKKALVTLKGRKTIDVYKMKTK